MDTNVNKLLIAHKDCHKIIDEIKTHLIDLRFDIDNKIIWKCFAQLDEHNPSAEELTQLQTIVIIGASVEAAQEFNQRIRTNGSNDSLRIIVSNIGQTSVYLFTDCGPTVKHSPIDDYWKSVIDDSVSEETNQLFHPFESIISGLICGQILSSRKPSNQLFSYKIDPQIVVNQFGSDRPVIVIGLGSLGFAVVKQLVRIGAKYLILIDIDVVHKYNLRDNYFNESQIGLKKCEVVKDFVLNANNEIKVEAFAVRAEQASNQFFEDMTKANAIIVSAVDNTETKRFLNNVCLNHCLPFIDVGVDGHMFHIQPIVPHLTESYFTHSDPSDPDYPLCVLKSFPNIIEHCVQWSKTKFDNWFNKRAKRANNWIECLYNSRLIFEKFFNRKAKQLLFSIPLERKDENGIDFWSDKLPPHPIDFDLSNDLHKDFVILCAQLIANVNNIEVTEDTDINSVLSSLNIEEFVGKNDKLIITDPSITQTPTDGNPDLKLNDGLKRVVYSRDNENHLKFIHNITNLRANMYGIEISSISEVNRIYNRIIDCFGFTLWTASAMVSIELIKLYQMNGKYGLTYEPNFKNGNYFYNLFDLEACVSAQPKRPNKTKLSNSCYLTEWDQWLINESESMSTLEDVLNELRVRSGSVCTMMVMNQKSIYLPELFPHHLKRKKQTMRDIIANYYTFIPPFVTLSVSFESENEDISGPNIKYMFTQNFN